MRGGAFNAQSVFSWPSVVLALSQLAGPRPPPGYGYRTWNGCPPNWTIQGGAASRTKVLSVEDGTLGTAAPRITQSKAPFVSPIEKTVPRLDYSARAFAALPIEDRIVRGSGSCPRCGGVAAVGRAIYSQTLTVGYVHTPWYPSHTGSPRVQ